MKRALIAVALLLGACTEQIQVTIKEPATGWVAYGVDSIVVDCYPARNVSYVELLIDSTVVATDSYPTFLFTWDVSRLREGSAHRAQAHAVAGSRDYWSSELTATVGFKSRVLVGDLTDSLFTCNPDGGRDTQFVPLAGTTPTWPRLTDGCAGVIFLAQHRLYRAEFGTQVSVELDSCENGIYACDAANTDSAVVYEGLPAATAHLFLRDAAGQLHQLTHDNDAVTIDSSLFTCTANADPAFSRDDGRIAFYRESKCLVSGDPHEGETRQDVFVMNRNGTGLVNLTPGIDNGYFSSLTWTSDGKWVLFREGSTATERILASNLSGHTVVVDGLGSQPVALACSPTDSALVFIGPDHGLYDVKLSWTADTLYTVGSAVELGQEQYGDYVDWKARH